MSLTELQLPNKTDFYRSLQSAATQMDELMNKWKNMSEILALVEASDLDSMGVATGVVRTDLVNFRLAVNDLVNLYFGAAVTPANTPAIVIDRIRRVV